ncbi:MAG TPA: hypothetical protein VLD86_14470 [Ilumatobacteraceae bacterium]|nr:hypothetical protein [Ilumatobacteraceae bacterium]
MADLERTAVRVADGLRVVLAKVGSVALTAARVAVVIGIATFATGWWVFDGSRLTWTVVGGVLCFAPCVAAVIAWYRVRRTMRAAPRLVGDVRSLMNESPEAANMLIEYDADQRLMYASRKFTPLRTSIRERRKDLPALWAGVRAATTLPGLAALAVLGTLAVGALGTILLIGGLID